jgi:AcrR family transcriptional regulator
VVDAATRLFAERGYHGSGVADIGREAGIQRGALYYHIGSKEELLFDVLRRHVEESLAGEERIAAADLDPEQKFRALLRHHIRTATTRRHEARIYIADASALNDEHAAQLQRLRARVEQIWIDILEEGVAAGVFRTADHVVVNGLLGLANTVFLWYRPDGPRDPDQIADTYSEVLLDGLRRR